MPIRFTTAGESHGRGLVGVLEGVPAGLPLAAEAINAELQRRMGGYGRGARMKIEADQIVWLAGVRAGATLRAPIALGVMHHVSEDWEAVGASAAHSPPPPEPRPRRGPTGPRPAPA